MKGHTFIVGEIVAPVQRGLSAEAAKRVLEIARQQPGFLGYEGARQEMGVSVSYWESLEAIQAWKAHPDHRKVQEKEALWYRESRIRVCKVERDY